MKTMRILIYCLSLALLGSCKKDDDVVSPSSSSDGTPYFVEMTDAPGPYKAVNIDLKAVEVVGGGKTMMLQANSGVYNLLSLSNGKQILIGSGTLNVSTVEQIRLILGTNNTIVTSDGVIHQLSTPSADQTGLKLQVDQQLKAGVAYHVLLDFDANQSIVEHGDGSFSLKPVIRTVEVASSGSMKGKVSKVGVLTAITATSGGFSFSTNVNANGEFTLRGLPPGVYSLTCKPVAPFSASTIGSIVVTKGSTTDVGIIPI